MNATLRFILLSTGLLAACGTMQRPPETLEARCARNPELPMCRFQR